MEKYRFDCSKMSDEQISEKIKLFTDIGWNFDGYIDFPPTHLWACLSWDKLDNPIYPLNKT